FPVDDPDSFEPELTVIYTPNLAVDGYPNDRVISVNLEHGVTRICNSDYFGESKKGGLRMWNKLVYDRGGLPLHAGCKVIPTSDTQNGRATFSFASIEAADARELESADFLLTLNRNENIIPAVAKLNAEQAAAYFMLGETQGTSAGGAEEAGKFLRVPGTNPF